MPIFLVLILLMLLAFFCFACYGFITFLEKTFGTSETSSNEDQTASSGSRNLEDDVEGAEHLLNYLLIRDKIDNKTYRQLREKLKAEFPDHPTLSGPVEFIDDLSTAKQKSETLIRDTSVETAKPKDELVVRTVVDDSEVTLVSNLANAASTGQLSSANPNQRKLAPAPWDLPDPPAPEPSRTFKEMMAGFMLEKNIRWGELASGILIVGSAVGLVVSLRAELRDTIPYFPALLFLLITAAIHGAGIYTLKKWKLRNTSRGILIIGLLLIPLNFLAACILSTDGVDRRELTDPLLWTAIGVGLISFGAMTWFSGKCLLRRGQLPLVLATIGSAIGTLVINRAVGIDESSVRKLWLSLPLALSFLGGTVLIFRKQWVRERWLQRTAFRVFTFLGIAAFAFSAAASLLIIRATDKPGAIVALASSFSVVAVITSWLGHIIWKGSSGTDSKSTEITGLSLHIMGLTAAAGAWFASLYNPAVLLVTSGLLASSLLLFGYQRRESRALFAGWLGVGSFIFCGINLMRGKLQWDVWTSFPELGNAALSGPTGIAMLLTGAVVIGMHLLLRRIAPDARKLCTYGAISGGLLSVVGCLLALVASFVDRNNVFDNMTATWLLGLTSVAAIFGCHQYAKSNFANDKQSDTNHLSFRSNRWLAVAPAAAVLLAFLAHAFGWNLTLTEWLNKTAFSINGNWPVIFTSHATILAIATAVSYAFSFRNKPEQSLPVKLHSEFADIAKFTSAIGLGSSMLLLQHQTGLATLIGLAIVASCLLFMWALQNAEQGETRRWSITFSILTAITVCFAVVELLTREAWCPSVEEPSHWLIQISALSVWLIVLLVAAWFLGKFKSLKKFTDIGMNFPVMAAMGLTLGFLMVTIPALVGESNLELFKDAVDPAIQLSQEIHWPFVAAGLLMIALLLAVFRHPIVPLGAAILTVWTITWCLGSLFFADVKAVATTMRWLVPIGGAIGAVMVASRRPFVPAWAAARNQFGLDGRSTWRKNSTQDLISLSLVISSIIVLSISTIAIVQFMMFGGADGLGGPLKGTLFGDMKKDISYGLPIGIIVNTFFLYAISERRKWLATAGSAVFQYCVVFAVVLLFISPHPKLASDWFVKILQAVSVGMTGYGLVWWYFRKRIGTPDQQDSSPQADSSVQTSGTRFWPSQLEIHTTINGFLITSLAVLVISRFFRLPLESGDWINSVGKPLGIGAWAFFGALVVLVWRHQLVKAHRTSTWMWLSCWSGLVLVGMLAAVFDRYFATDSITKLYRPWMTFNLIMWGAITVCIAQVLLLYFVGQRTTDRAVRAVEIYQQKSTWSLRSDQSIPLLFAGMVAFAFAFRGMWSNSADLWTYLTATGILVAIATVAGFVRQSSLFGFVSAGLTTVGTVFLIQVDPNSWFAGNTAQPYIINVPGLSLVLLAMIWCGYYIIQTVIRKQEIRSRLVWMPNVVMLLAGIWCLFGALVQWGIEASNIPENCMRNGWGIAFFLSTAALVFIQLWNRARKGTAIAGMMWWFAIIIFTTSVAIPTDGQRETSVVLATGCGVGFLGWFWLLRKQWMPMLTKLHAPNMVKLEKSLYWQLPTAGTVVGLFVIFAAFITTFFADVRLERYLTAFSPFGLAIGFGCWSDATRRRWVQIVSLGLLTAGMIFVSWADLHPQEIQADATRLFVRMLLVLAGAMFVYGWIVSRFSREGDRWLLSLREMSVVTCGLAIICFAVVLFHEFTRFVPDVGCGMPLAEAMAVTAAVIGMGFGLLVIAVRPKNDPFAFSLQGRMGYVYVAQLMAAMLVVHLYFTMPFLFQIGIRHYWPYLALIMCFGGVGMAHLLEKRKLTVLGQPIFNTAAILPVLVAVLIWGVDSKADHALVTLIAGLAYLMISYTHNSLLSGAAAIVFGNLALWLFYGKIDGFTFLEHPQLWLIPPATSVLIAAQISKARLTASQLATIRYICVATIYLSSTSEIFINGLGSKLWPPMVLALLSVAGILVGIMLQVRAYLYLGAVFLLMAMITMVSHAHQSLDHVWPWWAFGITLGIAILVMFGLFEKRKNDLQQVVGQLKQWEY